MTEEFVSEAIRPVKKMLEGSQSGPGEPFFPMEFTWRNKAVRVTNILSKWKDTSMCRNGSAEQYVRRHWYEVATESDGSTKIYCELDQRVTSKKKETSLGQLVRARVWRNVVVDGQTVIEAGSPMVVRVSAIKGARVAGRKGSITLEAVTTRAEDGQEVMLDGGYDRSGKGKMGLSLTLFAHPGASRTERMTLAFG